MFLKMNGTVAIGRRPVNTSILCSAFRKKRDYGSLQGRCSNVIPILQRCSVEFDRKRMNNYALNASFQTEMLGLSSMDRSGLMVEYQILPFICLVSTTVSLHGSGSTHVNAFEFLESCDRHPPVRRRELHLKKKITRNALVEAREYFKSPPPHRPPPPSKPPPPPVHPADARTHDDDDNDVSLSIITVVIMTSGYLFSGDTLASKS